MLSLGGVQKVIAMDLIILQETVPFCAIVDKDSLKTGFNARDNPFIYIAVGNLLKTIFNTKSFKFVFLLKEKTLLP